jgi:hypothetical protein
MNKKTSRSTDLDVYTKRLDLEAFEDALVRGSLVIPRETQQKVSVHLDGVVEQARIILKNVAEARGPDGESDRYILRAIKSSTESFCRPQEDSPPRS